MPNNTYHGNSRDDSFTLPAGAVPDLDLAALRCGADDPDYVPPDDAKLEGGYGYGYTPSYGYTPVARKPVSEGKPFVPLDEFCQQPSATSWLVRGYLELDSLAAFFGDSEAGKSFVMVDLGVCRTWGTKPG